MERFQRYRPIIFSALCAVLTTACSRSATHVEAEQNLAKETVIVRNLPKPGAFEIQNQGPSLSLSSQIIVQRMEEGTWADAATDVYLSPTCEWNPPTCRTLDHGATLRPIPWNGMSCGGQCPMSCRANVFLGPGQFRFVVTSCDRKQHFYSPVFAISANDPTELKKK